MSSSEHDRSGEPPEGEGARFELFHRLGDLSCGRIRTRVVELGLEPLAYFRNVGFDSHRAVFEERHGRLLPSIWSSGRLYEGEVACEVFVSDLARTERQTGG